MQKIFFIERTVSAKLGHKLPDQTDTYCNEFSTERLLNIHSILPPRLGVKDSQFLWLLHLIRAQTSCCDIVKKEQPVEDESKAISQYLPSIRRQNQKEILTFPFYLQQ